MRLILYNSNNVIIVSLVDINTFYSEDILFH